MLDTDLKQYKEDQRQGWDKAAIAWQKWWTIIEKNAQELSDRLVELSNIQPGSKVLDVATGIGEPAITAAKKMSNTGGGHVLAIDLSSQMLSVAKQRASSCGLQNIEFRQ